MSPLFFVWSLKIIKAFAFFIYQKWDDVLSPTVEDLQP